MGIEITKKSLKDILEGFNKIIIPDVQRDYVMGSGGKKFEVLLTAMLESIEEKNESFNFSCLVGYKDQNNYLYVYDGQQRVATLVYLCACLKGTNTEILRKFSFSGRDLANSWLENPKVINKYNAVDFTTYSLAKLFEEFNKINNLQPYWKPKVSFEFLFNKVIFDMILVDEISDAEQFFLDINDGLDLKYYEVFKAELFHRASSRKVLGVEHFKEFALKMENEWLKFFLPYSGKKIKKINGRKTEIAICEEEVLVYFMQYCFRMMWIEENGNDDEYKITDVSWLTKEHLTRFECILDVVIKKLKNDSSGQLSCISYQNDTSNCRGQHWNICDKNYVEMLKTFLSNLFNIDETRKDVVIWCYISKLPLVGHTEDVLYEYLRFVKKILNNNRGTYKWAYFNRGGSTPDFNYIRYARYYVLGIPQYYNSQPSETYNSNDESSSFFYSVIDFNKKYKSSIIELCTDDFIKECENELFKNTLLKEIKKQNSEDKDIIKKYEDLPFINGLADNFLDYTKELCELHKFCNDEFYLQLSNIDYRAEDKKYIDILKFIDEHKIDLNKILFEDINIFWNNYCDTKYDSKGHLVPHNWCDFFTSEKGLKYNVRRLNYPLHALPDGWISNDMKIVQPAENDVNDKKGFAAWGKTKVVWDMKNFLENFSYIIIEQEHEFIINGDKKDSLPYYLNCYNDKNWVINRLSMDTKVYFSDEDYLNKILLYMFKAISNKREEMDIRKFLKKYKEHMQFEEMNEDKFFIKLHEI